MPTIEVERVAPAPKPHDNPEFILARVPGAVASCTTGTPELPLLVFLCGARAIVRVVENAKVCGVNPFEEGGVIYHPMVATAMKELGKIRRTFGESFGRSCHVLNETLRAYLREAWSQRFSKRDFVVLPELLLIAPAPASAVAGQGQGQGQGLEEPISPPATSTAEGAGGKHFLDEPKMTHAKEGELCD